MPALPQAAATSKPRCTALPPGSVAEPSAPGKPTTTIQGRAKLFALLAFSRTNADSPDCVNSVQIEPAGATAGKSFSGSNTLLKKFVREYMATSATISMTFASV